MAKPSFPLEHPAAPAFCPVTQPTGAKAEIPVLHPPAAPDPAAHPNKLTPSPSLQLMSAVLPVMHPVAAEPLLQGGAPLARKISSHWGLIYLLFFIRTSLFFSPTKSKNPAPSTLNIHDITVGLLSQGTHQII